MEDVESQVERLFLDAQNLLLKMKLKEIRKGRVTLEEVEKVVQEELKVEEDVEDITEIIRQMRERDYEFEY
ncbi:hypothetical protein GQS_01495 [Thermococcus sp. 4557]|uniref:hypothetical protein n=1 Tax=Thermococcus sp. (strain CGMCC 1.5172 / 4557) TaxID=1042877 RepID=UPI000219EBB9|nr:hypothetical protein [Thermococcus sp. 4557]AEK72201.1 hypothetical protein GQS_01495 [Thermococcus sp. 4557]